MHILLGQYCTLLNSSTIAVDDASVVLVLKEPRVVTNNPSKPADLAESRSCDPTVPVCGRAASGSREIELGGQRYLTEARLASVLGVTQRTLCRWRIRGIAPPRTKIGRLVLIPVEKLPDWLASRETEPVRGRRK
jgi:hypothetical protein